MDDYDYLLALTVTHDSELSIKFAEFVKESQNASSEELVKAVSGKSLPYRDRAEMYALKDGKVYGSIYPDTKSFGVYGGGIDPGETPEQAAVREFQEESGWSVKNPKLLPIEPYAHDWKPPYKNAKQKERAKQYRGSRTHYVTGELGDQIPNAKLDELKRKNARLYDLDEALKLALPPEDVPNRDGLLLANQRRLKVLQHLQGNLKTAFENSVPKLLLVKRSKDSSSPFTIAVDLDGTLAKKEEHFSSKNIGKPIERTIYWVRLFHQAGARIIIFTVRGNTAQVKEWLEEHDVPFDYINENPDQPEDSSGKVIADAYFDDRAYNAEDPDEHGPTILNKVLNHGNEGKEEDSSDPSITICVHKTTIFMAAPDILDAMENNQYERED